MRSPVPHQGELLFVLALLLLLFALLDMPLSESPRSSPRLVGSTTTPAVEFSLSRFELQCIIEDSLGKRRLVKHDSLLVLSYSRPLEHLSIRVTVDSAGHLVWHSTHPEAARPIRIKPYGEQRRVELVWHFPWQKPILPPGEHVYWLRIRASYATEQGTQTEQLTARLRVLVVTAAPLPASPSPVMGSVSPQPLSLVPISPLIEVPPHALWENEVVVYGLNLATDLASAPQISISGAPNGNATTRVDPKLNRLLLSGKAPSEGEMQVSITLARRSDGERATAYFSIVAHPLPSPHVPKEMYPERTYTLQPNLQLQGQIARAELYDNRQHLLRRSSPGTPFTFTPELSDTGTTLLFRRFVNEQLLDETPILIRDYPPPEILNTSREKEGLKVRTRCFGTVEGRPNQCQLTVYGPGKARELYGDKRYYTKEPYGTTVEQVFLVEGPDLTRVELLIRDRAGRQTQWSQKAPR